MQQNRGLSVNHVVINAGKLRVMLFGGSNGDSRVGSANFGWVWLQGKAMDIPTYQQLSHESVDLWPNFRTELMDTTAIDNQDERDGGVPIYHSTTRCWHHRDRSG